MALFRDLVFAIRQHFVDTLKGKTNSYGPVRIRH